MADTTIYQACTANIDENDIGMMLKCVAEEAQQVRELTTTVGHVLTQPLPINLMMSYDMIFIYFLMPAPHNLSYLNTQPTSIAATRRFDLWHQLILSHLRRSSRILHATWLRHVVCG